MDPDSVRHRRSAGDGHGTDVALVRADDLDLMAVARLRRLGPGARALDLGCGHGGQAVRMAETGATVVACDLHDFAAAIAQRAAGLANPPIFLRCDARALPPDFGGGEFDVVISQRMIHYLRFDEAVATLRRLRALMRPGARLYLSASGLRSELGEGYPHRDLPLERRFAPLSEPMRRKHRIHPPVCLYERDDLARLLTDAGYRVEALFVSPFGNVKAAAALD